MIRCPLCKSKRIKSIDMEVTSSDLRMAMRYVEQLNVSIGIRVTEELKCQQCNFKWTAYRMIRGKNEILPQM
jgi:hypothetical protein